MNDCLFCKIITGDIPARKVYENDWVFCFADIAPQAPTHVLVVPRKHVANLNEAVAEPMLMQQVCLAAAEVAKQEGLAHSGYRTVMNTGADACQSVQHLHMHVLGGKKLEENMG